MSREHAIATSKQLGRFPHDGRFLGLGSRQNDDRVLSGVWTPEGSVWRFAGYIERDGQLKDHRIIEGIPAAVAFLMGP